MRSMRDPPSPEARATFAPGFGQRALLTVDTEEEFDWSQPFDRDNRSLTHLPQLARFQAFCEELGVVPLYLVDWPVATSQAAQEILGPAITAGRAEVGVQLHPWVNPPHEETVNETNSFAGNLPPALERDKFNRLRDAIAEGFGVAPLSYRAGRYGLGDDTAQMLIDGGIAMDTSVRTHFDYTAAGGPDYSAHPLHPYWIDAEQRLLELPVTTTYWGVLRRQGTGLNRLAAGVPRLPGLLARTGLLERIPLTPEGVGVEEAIRGIDMALDDGLPLLVFSFHSPSLAPGNTPYVRSEADVEALYDWWRRVYAYLAMRNVAPTSIADISDAIVR